MDTRSLGIPWAIGNDKERMTDFSCHFLFDRNPNPKAPIRTRTMTIGMSGVLDGPADEES
jgi:hypothetical protein